MYFVYKLISLCFLKQEQHDQMASLSCCHTFPTRVEISSGKLLWFLASDITYKDFNSSDGYLTGSEVRFPQSWVLLKCKCLFIQMAVALFVFLGWLRAHQFYFEYPTFVLLRFCTVGFCAMGSLIISFLFLCRLLIFQKL